MNNKQFLKQLSETHACSDAVEWVNGLPLAKAYEQCERADWALWWLVKAGIGTEKERTHLICDCAELALKYVPEGEERPRLALEAARAYADNPTEKNRAAANAASRAASRAPDAAADAAANAADAAANAADAAADAAGVAANAADAAADAAGVADAANAASRAASRAANAAANAAGRKEMQLKMCALIRKALPLERVLKELES